ncbi:hypothetical protein BD779DRAFT_355063 [Infundibulicybe gibba]|nr:hypothetical protein BD779DRAFT_355063 [Infundibulicybe gibba]
MTSNGISSTHPLNIPTMIHIPSAPSTTTPNATAHVYPNAKSPFFILPQTQDYDSPSASLAHTRTLVFLRKHLGGPFFDLEAIWEEHTHFEFVERSVAKTMGTMVAEPYVNHIPTMTGGMGRENLTAFYRDHFIFANPADVALNPISRTIGPDRIIDEFIYTITHDKVIPWFLPGVPPSGRKLEVPLMAVVCVRGDRLYNEHIWWDQATALFQAGVLPTHVDYPGDTSGKKLRLPVAGVETAAMLKDERSGNSNIMLEGTWGGN